MQIQVNAETMEEANEWLWYVFTSLASSMPSASFTYSPQKYGSERRIVLGEAVIDNRSYTATLHYERIGEIRYLEWLFEGKAVVKSSHPLAQWTDDRTREWRNKESVTWEVSIEPFIVPFRAKWKEYAVVAVTPLKKTIHEFLALHPQPIDKFNVKVLCKPNVSHSLSLFSKAQSFLKGGVEIEVGITLLVSSLEALILEESTKVERCDGCGQVKYSIGERVVDFLVTNTSLTKRVAHEWYAQRSAFLHTGNTMVNSVALPTLSSDDPTGCVREIEGDIAVLVEEVTRAMVTYIVTLGQVES